MGDEVCRYGGKKLKNENCEVPDPLDGLPDQSVGAWSRRKHARLSEYLQATWAARANYLEPKGRGGAAFVDLFAGPGRVRVWDSPTTEEGSSLIALGHRPAPFTRVIMCELNADNARALRARTAADRRAIVIEGDCNERVGDVVDLVPPHGLNLAFFDPFGAKTFHWQTLERLAAVRRMDLLIHFPTLTIKRNLFNDTAPEFHQTVTAMLGTDAWKQRVRKASEVHRLIDVLQERLSAVGYSERRVKTMQIVNDTNGVLYHLVFASKDPLGTKLWESISRHDGPQRGLGL